MEWSYHRRKLLQPWQREVKQGHVPIGIELKPLRNAAISFWEQTEDYWEIANAARV